MRDLIELFERSQQFTPDAIMVAAVCVADAKAKSIDARAKRGERADIAVATELRMIAHQEVPRPLLERRQRLVAGPLFLECCLLYTSRCV